MAMIIKHLPIELVLNTLTMFTDIRDIMSFLKSNKDIEKIIINNFNILLRILLFVTKFVIVK